MKIIIKLTEDVSVEYESRKHLSYKTHKKFEKLIKKKFLADVMKDDKKKK